jgi:hypothetical protein
MGTGGRYSLKLGPRAERINAIAGQGVDVQAPVGSSRAPLSDPRHEPKYRGRRTR